jgi:hypothetical protein
VRRARPPQFDQREVSGVFFDNVFSVLAGDRPARLSGGQSQIASEENGGPAPPSELADNASGWSRLVSGQTIEDEVKGIKQNLDQSLSSLRRFLGEGRLRCRDDFALLAFLFAVVHEYQGDIRWKRDARAASGVFAKASADCAESSPAAYEQAKQRRADLQDLLDGNSLPGSTGAMANDWPRIVDRSTLMKRLQSAEQERLLPSTAHVGELAKHRDTVIHEAEMVAIIGEVLLQPDMEYADDEEYAGLAATMRDAASRIVEAAGQGDAEQARASAGQVSQSCSACHDTYRL